MSMNTVKIDELYGGGVPMARERFAKLKTEFERLFDQTPQSFYRAPGRVELGGNHTDHQGGVTLSAAVDVDMIAAISSRTDSWIRLYSEGNGWLEADWADTGLKPEEAGSSLALLRGMMAGVLTAAPKEAGEMGGLNILVQSRIPQGSGLSSSAAFEILLGTILNDNCAAGALSPLQLARIAQKTENEYFGKPCGLLDQLSCGWGGIISVDFAGDEPWVRSLSFDWEKTDYRLFMVLCGAGHEKLTEAYAAIPAECRQVAGFFGQEKLSQVPEMDFWRNLPAIRQQAGDRAALRAMHVFEENHRALSQAICLIKGDMEGFLRLVRESGRSSAMYLQNVTLPGSAFHQEMTLVLALCEHILRGRGAVRVHGGGFGGTAVAFVPKDRAGAFREQLEAVLGPGCLLELSICPYGGTGVDIE